MLTAKIYSLITSPSFFILSLSKTNFIVSILNQLFYKYYIRVEMLINAAMHTLRVAY